jgi:hypothetical protein
MAKPKQPYAVVMSSEIAAAGGILSAKYWVHKKSGQDPYYVEGNTITKADVSKGLATWKKIVWLSPEQLQEFEKALADKAAAQAEIDRLNKDMDDLGSG